MKKKSIHLIILTALISVFSFADAQNNIQNLIQGEKGTTTPFTRLTPEQQVTFSQPAVKSILGLDVNSDLSLINTEQDQIGETHYRFNQTYIGIPIENTMYIINVKNNNLIGMSGSIILDFDKEMNSRSNASINASDALTIALNSVNAHSYAWQNLNMEQQLKEEMNNSNATYYPSTSLCWYSSGDVIEPKNLRLCYKIDIYSTTPLSRAYYFIDALSGKILGKKDVLCFSDATGTANTAYSGTQTIHSDFNGNTYRLRDLTKGNGIITLTSAGADYSNTSANWNITGANQYALDAHYGVSQTWQFYMTNFNRNSINNAGYALTSYVNESATPNNAYWNGTSMHFGVRSSDGSGITAIDIDGHELTHGVTQYTSNLNYSNQSGAINESMSDIFGKSVQFWSKPTDVNWLLSNDMNWNIRNMANPNAYSHPDTYLGTYWYTGTGDNGGVHYNSGVGNFMFYLLVTGGSGTNDIGSAYTVSGLGLTIADAIIYRSETVYLTPTSQYSNWRTACINAATDLYGASSNEVNQVMNAWYAVGIGSAAPSGTCPIPSGLASSAITDNSATVNWSTVAGAASYVLQYKTAAGSTWSSVATASTTANLTGLISGTTYNYQLQSICSAGGNTAFSTASSFTTTGIAPIIYCTSVGQTFDGITNVTFNTINNTTSGTSSGYTDYTATQSTTVTQGSPYSLTIKINTGGNYTNYSKAWIDWNKDGTFSTSTEEYNLGTAVNVTNGNTSLSPLSITVPATATIGTTRMRVSTQYSVVPTPCNASFDGEVEDYSVVVTAGVSCSTPGGLTAGSITSSSAILSWGSTSATTYNLQWKLASSGTWTTVTSLTTTSYALTGLTACSAYNYQVQGVCTGGSGVYSTASSFTTLGIAATITAGGPTIFCQGGSVLLSGNSSSGTWSVGGGNTATLSATTTGDYFVTTTNACGTYVSNHISVIVNPLPTASVISAGGPTTFCSGGNVLISGNSSGGTWSVGGGNTATLSATTTGDYFTTTTNSCGSATSNHISVVVNPLPTASVISAGGPTTFCSGGNVLISGNSSSGTWSVGGGNTATLSAATDGDYFITNSNTCGSVESNHISVTVNYLPTASILSAGGPTTLCSGGSVLISGNSSGGTWSVGGGTTATLSATTDGDYFVTNSNTCGSFESNHISVVVNPLPTASVISAGGSVTFCSGGSVLISGNSSGGTWSVGGGTTATLSATTTGDYFTTTSNSCGSFESNHISVVVNPLPTASVISAGSSVTFCSGGSVLLSGNSSGGTWSVGGGTTTTLSATTTGDYFTTTTNSCGSATSNHISVIVNPLPTASVISAGGPTTFCSGGSVLLSGNSSDGTWSVGGGTTATLSAITTGDYFTTTTNSCGSATSNHISVIVSGTVPATPGTITGNAKACPGDVLTYSIAAVINATSYNWTAPTGATISAGQGTTIVSLTFNSGFTATSSLSVKATNGCGTSSSRTISISRNTPATPSTIVGNASGNCNTSGNYSVTLVSGMTYTWTVPTGASIASGQGTNAVSVNFGPSFVSGNLYVKATNGCSTSSKRTLALTAKPSIPTSITGLATSVCIGSIQTYSTALVTGATTYTWTAPTGSVIQSGQGSISISVLIGSANGNFTVKASNACGVSSNRTMAITVATCVRVENETVANLFFVSPNPCSNCFVNGATDENELIITDILGRKISVQFSQSGNGLYINMPFESAAGLYIIRNIKTGQIAKFEKY